MKIRRQRRKTKCAYKFQVYFYFCMCFFFLLLLLKLAIVLFADITRLHLSLEYSFAEIFFKNSLRKDRSWVFYLVLLKNITCYSRHVSQSRITNTSVGSPRYLQGTIVISMQSLCYIHYMLMLYLSTSQSPSTLV